MNIKNYFLPRKGDSDAFSVEIWHNRKLEFAMVCKLTGTELATSIANGCVTNKKEALKKLEKFSIDEAKKIFASQAYQKGIKIQQFFSPCW